MQVSVTPKLREVLTRASESSSLSPSLKQDAGAYLKEEVVPFSLVNSCCTALRGHEGAGPWIDEVCRGSQICLSPPSGRQRSPEFNRRLEELRHQEAERKYQAMVHGVAKRDFEDSSFKLLPTVRLQLSFGAHVLLTMLVFFLIGSYGSRVFSESPVFRTLGGVVGLTFGLILETTLFILRSMPIEKGRSSVE